MYLPVNESLGVNKMENSQPYVAHFICTGNDCRSRMAQGIIEETIGAQNLEGRLEARSSGIQVDDLKAWGKTKELKWDSIVKVLKVAHSNGIHSMAGYKAFVESIIANEQKAKGMHDSDASYRHDVNLAASKIYELVEMFDKGSTMLVLAENNIIYPAGDPRQFVPDKSSLYVPMERKHHEKVAATVEQTGEKGRIISFDDFVGREMKGSLGAIRYRDGILDITGFREIYQTIKEGCTKLEVYVLKELGIAKAQHGNP